MYKPSFGKISKKNWIFFPFTFIVHRKLFLLICFFRYFFLHCLLFRVRTYTHSLLMLYQFLYVSVSVSVAFSISFPVFSLPWYRSSVDSQRTTHTHQNIRDVGKEKWQHSFPSYVFTVSLFFFQCMRLCLIVSFSFRSNHIYNIANKSIIVTTTTVTTPPPSSCCHCSVANINFK